MFCAVFTTPWCPLPPIPSSLFATLGTTIKHIIGMDHLLWLSAKRKEKKYYEKKCQIIVQVWKILETIKIFCLLIPCLPVIFSEIENYAFKISLKIPIYENMNRPTIMHLDNWLDLKRPCETKLNCYIMFSCC